MLHDVRLVVGLNERPSAAVAGREFEQHALTEAAVARELRAHMSSAQSATERLRWNLTTLEQNEAEGTRATTRS